MRMSNPLPAVPASHPVQPLYADDPRADTQCGTCGRWWDDDASTSLTPAPSGRCPFEYYHPEPQRDECGQCGRELDEDGCPDLVEAGIVKWYPGGVVEGQPVPGHARIIKAALVELVAAARPVLAALRAKRDALTRERIKGLRNTLGPARSRRRRRSAHTEVSSGLSSPTGEYCPPSGGGQCPHGEPAGSRYCALCRYAIV